MVSSGSLRITATALLLLSPVAVAAVPKVSRTGRYLYTDDGNRFFIKGIVYQTQGNDTECALDVGVIVSGPDNPLNQPSTFVDNLADGAACTRDLPFFQKLGVNTIRAYAANSSLDHDSCMSTLSNAGIYVILDLTLPLNGSIDTTLPAWSTNTLDQYLRTIDAFEKYDNVLAYNIGNEVILPSATQSAPFIVAAARDIRAYLNSKSSSALVGYAAIDGSSSFVENVADFLACNRSAEPGNASIDLYGLNDYQWCGNASSNTFNGLNSQFANYGVPAYFSEFGSEDCSPNPRVWTEVPVMFNSSMTDVWSGGCAFSYFSASSRGHQFGMVTLSSDNSTVTTNGDFDNLAAQFNAVKFVNSPAQVSVKAAPLPACPATASSWPVSNTLPPTPDDTACGCLADALSCVFQPPTPDYMVLVGELIGIACGLYGQAGGSCDDISADGETGVYGTVGMCDPTIKLTYIFSQYYESNHRAPDACLFSGNATINSAAGFNGASAAMTSCIPSPSATFTLSAPPVLIPVATPRTGNSTSNSTSTSSQGSTGGAGPKSAGGIFVGISGAVGCLVWGTLWTLL
ncbi:1,3-beta-glucanosyltransferase [Mycena maculata]|uniref:1,3-beta-glucanosyltransferase n=1 Tax=Mycena maculata TaxID=230809 RepID=A0AAD7NAF9_9AGAR|nr:1,3-beta-glucanosyltransferase [Mycena maculata]